MGVVACEAAAEGLARAAALACEHGLRGYDAVPSASALVWHEMQGETVAVATCDRSKGDHLATCEQASAGPVRSGRRTVVGPVPHPELYSPASGYASKPQEVSDSHDQISIVEFRAL